MIHPDERKHLGDAILNGPAYRLAHEDVEFLAQDDLRPLRMQLELLKIEHGLREQGIGSTVELFEVLTLVQTRKMPRLPIVLVGRTFWNRVIDFDYLVEEGFIDPQDVDLFAHVETAEQIVDVIQAFYAGRPPAHDTSSE